MGWASRRFSAGLSCPGVLGFSLLLPSAVRKQTSADWPTRSSVAMGEPADAGRALLGPDGPPRAAAGVSAAWSAVTIALADLRRLLTDISR